MEYTTFFALISRMKYVNRWGLMYNSRTENLMEHSFETAILAGVLAEIENHLFDGKYDVNGVTVAALYHDASEIITGDMPTPVKYISSPMLGAYKEVERQAQDKLLGTLPDFLKERYATYFQPDRETEVLVKAADKLSALLKCLQERQNGNDDFSAAYKSTFEKVRALPLKSVDYFLKHILPAYELTLDDLTK